jgi:cytochrome oxidase Cu insertion factor (SCO1/SenC/PrrC family)
MTRRTKRFGSLLLSAVLLSVWVGIGMAATVEVGKPAPDFTLPSTLGKKISLSQFKGKKHVLVQFYSVDFNPT